MKAIALVRVKLRCATWGHWLVRPPGSLGGNEWACGWCKADLEVRFPKGWPEGDVRFEPMPNGWARLRTTNHWQHAAQLFLCTLLGHQDTVALVWRDGAPWVCKLCMYCGQEWRS